MHVFHVVIERNILTVVCNRTKPKKPEYTDVLSAGSENLSWARRHRFLQKMGKPLNGIK